MTETRADDRRIARRATAPMAARLTAPLAQPLDRAGDARPDPHEPDAATSRPFDTAAALAAICRDAQDIPGAVADVVARLVDEHAPLAATDERRLLAADAIARLAGLDVLDDHLADDSVDEVMVTGGRDVWVERNHVVAHAGQLAAGTAERVLERILAPLGRRLDRTHPIVDARLPSGHRVCAIVPPVAVDGTTIAIRRHHQRRIALARFAAPPICDLIDEILSRRLNVLVTGATSTGKTTLLAALLRRSPSHERLVVVEDTTELDLDHDHVVRLEARPPTGDDVTTIGLDQLVRAALRLRPDRLVLGEFRGPEVLAVVQALNTGHDGTLATCHANSAADGLRRVESLVIQAAPSWPLDAVRDEIHRSLDVVVHLRRTATGGRRITEIAELADRSISGPLSVSTLAVDGRCVAQPERDRR